MPTYIYQRPDWPHFRWDQHALLSKLADVRHRQGRLIGRMEGLGFLLRAEAVLETLTLDIMKSSEIEGEILNAAQVRSLIARRLGIDIAATVPADRHVEGVVEMMLDATQHYVEPLTIDRLFGWHAALFPTGHSGMNRVIVGNWRDDHNGPMQVISGLVGRERIHFEAPPATELPSQMNAFITWCNSQGDADPVMHAAIAHLWFVTVHPFEDGNGRIARAIADWALARAEGSAQRFYSMSAQIHIECDAYYDILEQTQKGDLDITAWMEWFLDCHGRAIGNTEATLAKVLQKAAFWESVATKTINNRQRALLNKLLDGFDGALTSSKWAKIAKCSQDTAQRDIQALIEQGVLKKDAAGGRSTRYLLGELV